MYGVGKRRGPGTVYASSGASNISYDNVYRGDDEDVHTSHGFRSTRQKRFKFVSPSVDDIRDDEDVASGSEGLRVVSGVRDLIGDIDIQWHVVLGDEESHSVNPPCSKPSEKTRRKRRIVHYDEPPEGELEPLTFKLKKMDSKVKFQRGLVNTKPAPPPTDATFKGFCKSIQRATTPFIAEVNYIGKYSLSKGSLPLSKHAASTILQGRFTTSNTTGETLHSPQQHNERTVVKVEINPLLLKRLGI